MNERFRVDLLYDYCGGWNYWIGCYLREITMTPSEKKAREMEARKLASFLRTVIEGGGLESVGVASACVEKVSSALSEAERRGFERAKRMAVELCESLGNTSYSKETRVQIFENLKYEEA